MVILNIRYGYHGRYRRFITFNLKVSATGASHLHLYKLVESIFRQHHAAVFRLTEVRDRREDGLAARCATVNLRRRTLYSDMLYRIRGETHHLWSLETVSRADHTIFYDSHLLFGSQLI
jgi:hypothetical protein